MYDNDRERVGHNVTDFAAYGLSHLATGQADAANTHTPTTNPLVDHAAVTGYRGIGVATEDLTSFIESFASPLFLGASSRWTFRATGFVWS
jgi:hypothetical protein